MLRPSPNHGTQRLPNDDDDDIIQGRDSVADPGYIGGADFMIFMDGLS